MGQRGRVLVTCFFGWPDSSALNDLKTAQLAVASHHGKVLTVNVIPPIDLKKPGATLQQSRNERDSSLEQSASIGDELAKVTLASAMVVLMRGLVAVMVSSFVAGLSLLSRAQTPLKSFRTLADASSWLATVPGVEARDLDGLGEDIEAWLRTL